MKYKIPIHTKVKVKGPDLGDIVAEEPKERVLTEEEKEQANQREYHALANTFTNKKEGRPMTRKSMEDLLAKLT